MANRRMFSRAVTGSGRFLRLSAQCRALYYDLGMEADDDGFVEGFTRLAITGSSEETLTQLARAGFIQICDPENLVVYILDWHKNNLIRQDRYTPSIYKELYLPETQEKPVQETQEKPEQQTQEKPVQEQEPDPIPQEEPSETEEMVHQEETICHPDGCFLGDTRLTQVRLGKDSIGKGRLEQGSSEQLRKEKINLDQNRIGAGAARESDFDAEKSAPPQNEEAEIDFEEKRRNYMKNLLDSEYFKCIRAPSGNALTV